MATGYAKAIPDQLKYGTISVDSYDDKIPTGRLYYAHLGREVSFHGLMQLLLLTENAMQDMNYPAEYMRVRRFGPSANAGTGTCAECGGEKHPSGKLATFRIKILFRQNAGWQGTLAWIEGGQEQAFRSVLEFATLLDSALQTTAEYV